MSLLKRIERLSGAVILTVAVASTIASRAVPTAGAPWTAEERAALRAFTLGSLAALPADPSNKYADDAAAARLGTRLFFDTSLSANGQVSCATCHVPEKDFQDGIPLGKGVGTAGRRTMPIAGTARSPWQFWDGRADSQWAQALGPLESAVEHGGDRVQFAHLMRTQYKQEYEAVFGALPEMRGLPDHAGPVADSARARAWARIAPARQDELSRVYANVGKAIAAFERRITFTPARFDHYVAVELAGGEHTPASALSEDERAGLRLFIGRANCSTCHNGPQFTDDHFHNTGVPRSSDGAPNDSGRTTGVRAAMTSEFNCLSKFSDAKASECSELKFAVTDGTELVRAFKTPSLRNAVTRAPFMHAGQFTSMSAVLAHYNRAPAAPAGKSELKPLRLSNAQLRQIEAFLGTLSSPVESPRPPAAPQRTATAATPREP